MDVAHSHADLLERLSTFGWTLKKVDFKNGVYVAKGEGPAGTKIERDGKTAEMALANLVTFAARHNHTRQFFHAASARKAAWDTHWMEHSEEIAKAYAQLPHFDEKAVSAWQALAGETQTQADTIRQQITVELVDDPEPYLDAQEMREDIHKSRHLKVSRANTDHPLWNEEQVINFRVVHDVLGYAQSGSGFSWAGENMATAVHMPHVTPLAREALFVETIGKSAHTKHFRNHTPTRIALLTPFLDHAQEKEGEHVHVPHGGIADLHSTSVTAAKNVSENLPHDPNHYWQPPLEPHEMQPQINPSDSMHEGRDYLGKMGALANASKIDTEWWEKTPEVQDMAIMNAFRVALLSPRKHLKWNAAHYQAIMHTHPKASATELWHVLEKEREKHNKALGYPERSHLSYTQQIRFLVDWFVVHEEMSEHAAQERANRILYEKTRDFERILGEEHEEGKNTLSELRRYNKARALTAEWMKQTFNPPKPKKGPRFQPGQVPADPSFMPEIQQTLGSTGHEHQQLFDWEDEEPEAPKDATGFASDRSKYGAFMGDHLDGIAEVGQHIEAIRALALRDIEDDGGRGLVFRNGIMNMNMRGINPKVASFAWLLLRPTTSDLGIVDTHILRGMHLSEDDANPRDYYKIERMQRTAKDASGYQHVPLGVYHWGMWDMIRNPGEHSDHSPLRILDPKDWRSEKWDDATSASSGTYVGPEPFEATRPLMARAAAQFDAEFGDLPQSKVPDPRKVRTSAQKLADKEKEKFRKLKRKLNTMNAERFGIYAALEVKVSEKQLKKFLDEASKDFHHGTFSRFKREVMISYSDYSEGGPRVLMMLGSDDWTEDAVDS